LLSVRGTINIHGVDLGKEAIRVIRQMIRVSQNGLHRTGTCIQIIHTLSLIDQKIFKRASILVEDPGSLDTKVLNDLGAYVG
jgi:hypothetical protein